MIKIDLFSDPANPANAAANAAQLEAAGCHAIASFEGPHDPFLPLALAATTTSKVQLYPAIAVAFARNPMTLANTGYDLQLISKGRFALGLGTQIKPHIQRRYSMPWSHPVQRMRDMVRAIRSIWHSWETGEPLKYEGQFYNHTLMTPLFNPGPNPYGPPPIYLAGVGPAMTKMAGAEADGFLIHPLNTMKSLQELTLPKLKQGLADSNRPESSLTIICQLIVATGNDRETIAKSREMARMQVAFYSSTPAYRPILACHGYEDIQPQLRDLSVAGKWQEMPALVEDRLLDQIIVCGTAQEIATKLCEERGQLFERLALTSQIADQQPLLQIIAEVNKINASN